MNYRIGDRVRYIPGQGQDWHGRVGTVREVLPADPVHGVLPGLSVDFPDGSRIDTATDLFEPAVIGRHVRDGNRTYRVQAVEPVGDEVGVSPR